MKHRWFDVTCAAVLATVAGCDTILTFKPGASPDTMATDERACREGGNADFVDCMRDRGWYVKDSSAEPTPAAVAAETIPPRAAATPAAAPAAPAFIIAPSARPAAAAIATVAATPTATAAAVSESTVPVEPVGSGSLPRVRVGSWWKLGGTAGGLDAAIAACVVKLGAPHQPDANATVVTVALRDCLRADGWYPHDQSPVP